jgi:WS/DGAT/MGAT family acyltransferase
MTMHDMDRGDQAWLHMDRPTNLMVVDSVMWFDEPLDWDVVKSLLQERVIERFPTFSQLAVKHGTSVRWEDDENFDIGHHLRHVTLPAPGGRVELEEFMSRLLHHPLPVERPLWEMYLVDGYNGRGSAVISRIHHCIADGIALMRVMMSLTDDPNEAALADVADAATEHHHVGPIGTLGHLAAGVAGGVVGDVLHPSRIVDQAQDVTAVGKALARVLAMTPDAHTSLRGHTGRTKRVIWTDPIALHEVKRAAHAGGVTINDLLLAAVSGALRDHLIAKDGKAPDVRAIVPYNLRPLDKPLPAELGNKFGLVFLSLPVSVGERADRLAELRRRMDALKHSPEGVVVFGILDVIGHTPYSIEQIIVDIFSSKGTAIMTNVPGPRQPVFMAGRRVRGTIGWPPQAGNVGLGVSIISYDGEITVGLMTDDDLIPDPRPILDAVGRELDELMHLCNAVPVA